MATDDFQMFHERRKRRPLGDITNRNDAIAGTKRHALGHIASRSHITSLKSRAFNGYINALNTSVFPTRSQTVEQRTRIVEQRTRIVERRTRIAEKPTRIPIPRVLSMNNVITTTDPQTLVLILNLKGVLAESSFTTSNNTSNAYFDFLRCLVDKNKFTKISNDIVKDFANRQKLKQLLSHSKGAIVAEGVANSMKPMNAMKVPKMEKSMKRSDNTIEVNVEKVSIISKFMIAISTREIDDSLLLNTNGTSISKGLVLTLYEAQIFNLEGKDTKLFTSWTIKRDPIT